MMNKEIENVRRQMTIAGAKLDLYKNLNVEYDEQIKLIKEQVSKIYVDGSFPVLINLSLLAYISPYRLEAVFHFHFHFTIFIPGKFQLI